VIMKKFRISYFFLILMFAFCVMLLIVAAQVLTKRNINGLKIGNREAVITFTINNRLQELVNLSFELNTKVINQGNNITKSQALMDSLNMLGYNSSVLEKINQSNNTRSEFERLNHFIDLQVGYSMAILRGGGSTSKLDSLQKMKIADSVYSSALLLQKQLEKDLQQTLDKNTETSSSLSAYNKTVAIIAIAAVFILCTIIINRHIRQGQLIDQLEKATAAARESALIKDQFLANMSHEIRTPLNAIKGFSHLLSQTSLAKDQKEYAGIINEASGSLIHIVNDILDISKIEAGKFRIINREFNLEKILETTGQMFSSAAADKGLEYSQTVNENVPATLIGDPERLLQILINLISNGIKFTQKGFVRVDVVFVKDGSSKIWLEFLVEDSGMGIPDDKKEIVFRRFEQLHTGKESVIQGTGLGLSIVRNLAALMGGEITLSGKYGKGSAFRVLLPFGKKETLSFSEDAASKKINTENDFQHSVVLVVEDNKVNQLLIKNILGGLKLSIDVAANGEEAVAMVTKKKYGLILMDIQMPVMNGYDTTDLLRKKLNIETPIVAMTAFALPGEREKCIAAGMTDYLAKPLDLSQLLEVLKKHLTYKEKIETRHLGNGDDINFILQLSGGDAAIAEKILLQIQQELPATSIKLNALVDKGNFEGLKELCHHMVSTFSPLGNDTDVMKGIDQLREAEKKEEPAISEKVKDFICQLESLHSQTDRMLVKLNQQKK
jgi:signal transduction histidine kinase/DNA-binding NarL/FixJ family response regulator